MREDDELRTERILVQATLAERASVELLAAAAGTNISAIVRRGVELVADELHDDDHHEAAIRR